MKTETYTLGTDYRTIDGNYAKAVIGYCQYHRGYVTARQAKIHRCHLKHGGVCPRLQDMEGRHIRKVKTEVFYDKMLDRMDKMITAMNKLTRTLEAVEKWRNGMCISLTDGDVPKEEDIKKALEAMQKKSDLYVMNTAANYAEDEDV